MDGYVRRDGKMVQITDDIITISNSFRGYSNIRVYIFDVSQNSIFPFSYKQWDRRITNYELFTTA
jgi:hypothetical protein